MMANRLSVIPNHADDNDEDEEGSIHEFESPHSTPKPGANAGRGRRDKSQSVSKVKKRARLARQRIPDNLFEDDSPQIATDDSVRVRVLGELPMF